GGGTNSDCIYAHANATLTDYSGVEFCLAKTKSNANAKNGGIYSGTDVTLTNSGIAFAGANSASGGSYGGGIFSKGGTTAHYSNIYQTYATLTSNTSQKNGIFSKNNVEFKYKTISNRSAQQDDGIAAPTGNLYLRGATLEGNYAQFNAS